MGEATHQARLAVDAQRAELERTAAQLRDALDLPKKVRENPVKTAALGAGALFLLVGGPMRVARFARRRVMRSPTEKAYDGLPKTLQKWVDEIAGTVGPRADEARESLAAEFVRWRHDPKSEKKFRKELAKQMVDGPPGPNRAIWKAFEAGAAIVTAAMARRLVQEFLAGETTGGATLDAPPPTGPATPVTAPRAVGRPATDQASEGYSSMSSAKG
jgi:hypothetical protein